MTIEEKIKKYKEANKNNFLKFNNEIISLTKEDQNKQQKIDREVEQKIKEGKIVILEEEQKIGKNNGTYSQ